MKTNKSFTKRLKVSKNGKITARTTGQNHFNSRNSNRKQAAKRRSVGFPMVNKAKALYLNNSSI